MRQALLSAVAASFLAAMPAMAQPAPGPLAAAMAAEGHGTAPADGASLTHSAIKATTFKVATTVTNVALLSYAAGGIIGGTALSAFMLGSSWVLYTANDYFWDKYSPPAAKQASGQEFDASADVWRNTMKFLTYKPVIASIKLASLYVYTG